MKQQCLLIKSFFVIISIISLIMASDMTLITESGVELILHADNTWEYVDKNAPELKDGTNVTLTDNRTIRIEIDYSWRFVKKKELNSIEFTTVQNIKGKGHATHMVHSEANARAMKSAVDNATKKLKTAVKNRKLDFTKLRNCVRRVEKEEGYSENFTERKGWSVDIEIVLDRGSILAVLDCEAEKAGKEGKKKEDKK